MENKTIQKEGNERQRVFVAGYLPELCAELGTNRFRLYNIMINYSSDMSKSRRELFYYIWEHRRETLHSQYVHEMQERFPELREEQSL